MTPRPMIAVDFDGTICDFDFPRVGTLKVGVVDALQSFRNAGYLIHIYSCRACKWNPHIFCDSLEDLENVQWRRVFIEMKRFLDVHGVPYDSIDDGTKGKPMCDFYIDDKGVRFDNNWAEVKNFILSAKK